MKSHKQSSLQKGLGPQSGLSLFELLIVLAILALVTAIAAPRLAGQLSSAKSKSALIEIRSIAQSIEYFNLDVGRYPNEQEGIKALYERPAGLAVWNGPYLDVAADGLADPWGRAYHYKLPGAHKRFDIYSHGADGKPGGEGEDRDLGNWM